MYVGIGVHTARNRLRALYLLARRPTKKPLISKFNKKTWVDIARQYLHWPKEQ